MYTIETNPILPLKKRVILFLIMYMCDVCSLYSIQISNLNTIETNPILPLKKSYFVFNYGFAHTRAGAQTPEESTDSLELEL